MGIQSQQSHYNSCLAMMSTICFPLGETFPSKKGFLLHIKKGRLWYTSWTISSASQLYWCYKLILSSSQMLQNSFIMQLSKNSAVFQKIWEKNTIAFFSEWEKMQIILLLHCLFLVSLIRSQHFQYHRFLTRYNSSISQHIWSLIKEHSAQLSISFDF